MEQNFLGARSVPRVRGYAREARGLALSLPVHAVLRVLCGCEGREGEVSFPALPPCIAPPPFLTSFSGGWCHQRFLVCSPLPPHWPELSGATFVSSYGVIVQELCSGYWHLGEVAWLVPSILPPLLCLAHPLPYPAGNSRVRDSTSCGSGGRSGIPRAAVAVEAGRGSWLCQIQTAS